MKDIISFIIFLAFLMLIIVLHEAGHYFTAKKYGVIADGFSIGWGPRLFGIKDKNGTDFCVKLLPIGGACDFGTQDEKLMSLPAKNRIKILFAGPGVNLVLAVVSWAVLRFLVGDTPVEAAAGFFKTAWMLLFSTFSSLVQAFTATDVSLFKTTAEYGTMIAAASDTLAQVRILLAISYLCNLSLGLMNLLPIPALDGGQIALTIPELFHHPLPERAVNRLNFAFFMSLTVFSVGFLVIDTLRTVGMYLV